MWRETGLGLAPFRLEFYLLGKTQRIIHVNSKVANRSLDLGMTRK